MTDARLAPPLWEVTGSSPDAVALRDRHGALTWSALDEQTAGVAAWLADVGAEPGSHALLASTNRVEFVAALIGAMRAGLAVSPAKAGWTIDELDYVAGDAQTAVVLTDLSTGVTLGARRDLPVLHLDDLGEVAVQFGGVPVPYDRRGYRLSYTSGTTGRPKGVRLRGAGERPFSEAFTAGSAFCDVVGMPLDGPHQCVSALYHGAPLMFALGALGAGQEMRIIDRWDPHAALELLQDGVRSTAMVPTMFRQILELPAEVLDAFDAPQLACILHGGEPCPRPLKQQMIDRFGPIVTEYYGYSEGGFTRATSEEWLARPGTVGQALLGMSIEVRSEDGGQVLGPNEPGVIYFKDPGATPKFEYVNAPEKTASAYADQNVFTVGDIGFVDDDGWLFISGRTADVIVAAGVNIYPAEVEDVLVGVPAVAEACVVGGPDPRRGEQPVAFIVAAPRASPVAAVAAAEAAAAEKLARYQQPRRYEVVDHLDRDSTGKLLRRRMRERLWEGRDSVFAN